MRDRWIYRFCSCTGRGLAGRPSREGTPDLPFAGLQAALGSLPSVALSSAEANGLLTVQMCSRECFPFPFPGGVYRTGKGNGSGFERQIELIASAIVADHTGSG